MKTTTETAAEIVSELNAKTGAQLSEADGMFLAKMVDVMTEDYFAFEQKMAAMWQMQQKGNPVTVGSRKWKNACVQLWASTAFDPKALRVNRGK